MQAVNPERLVELSLRDRPIVRAAVVVATLLVLGTCGYTILTDMSVLEALYMTVITVSTVGYREVGHLDGPAMVFTIGLIVAGIGTVFYTVNAIAASVMEGSLRDLLGRRSMKRNIDHMQGHTILCGYGRFGRVLGEELDAANVPFVVIESDPLVVGELDQAGTPYVAGSALDEDVLRAAGVARANVLVAGMGSDADNVFLALEARELNPEIRIHARGETEAGLRRLREAGAVQVISPYHLGGMRVAQAIIRPAVVDFIELARPGVGSEMDLEEVVLAEGSTLTSLRLSDLPDRGIRVAVVAVKRHDGAMEVVPDANAPLRPGDRLVAAGDRANLQRLAELATG